MQRGYHNEVGQSLAYGELVMNDDGNVLTRDMIREKRLAKGFCPTCEDGEPVRLFDVRRSKYNPLYKSKIPLDIEGVCIKGKCLRCFPKLDTTRNRRAAQRRSMTGARPRQPNPSTRPMQHTGISSHASPQYATVSRPIPEHALAATVRPIAVLGNESDNQLPPPLIDTSPTSNTTLRSQDGIPGGETRNLADSHRPPPPINVSSPDIQGGSLAPPASAPPQQGRRDMVADQSGHPIRRSNSRVPDSDDDQRPSAPRRPQPPLHSEKPHQPRQEQQQRQQQWQQQEQRQDPNQHQSSPFASPPLNDTSTFEVETFKNTAPQEAAASMSSSNSQFSSDTSPRASGHRSSSMYNIVVNPDINSSASRLSVMPSPQVTRRTARSHSLPQDGLSLPGLGRRPSIHSMDNSVATMESVDSTTDFAETLFGYNRKESTRRLLRQSSVTGGKAFANGAAEKKDDSDDDIDEDDVMRQNELLIKDISSSGNANFTVDFIVQLMQNHRNSAKIQKFCISKMWDFFKNNQECQRSALTSSAPDDILLAMQKFMNDWRIQELGCGAIWALASVRDTRHILAKAGAASRIIMSLTRYMRVKELVLSALGALRTLSSEMSVRLDLVSLNAPEHIARTMTQHRNVAAVQRDGCAFLSNSAVDVERQEVATASREEIDAVVQAVAAHPNDPSVLTAAAFALKNYTFMDTNMRILLSCQDALIRVQHIMTDCADSRGRDYAMVVFDRLQTCLMDDQHLVESICSTMMENMQRNIRSPSSVTTVLNTMMENDWANQVVAMGFVALRTLANQTEAHKTRIGGNVLRDLVALIVRHKGNAEVQAAGCNLLAVMAEDRKNRFHIMDAQGLAVIIQALRAHMDDVGVQEATTNVLRALSVEFDCWFEMEKNGDSGIIEELMREHPTARTVLENCEAITTKFSAYSSTGVQGNDPTHIRH